MEEYTYGVWVRASSDWILITCCKVIDVHIGKYGKVAKFIFDGVEYESIVKAGFKPAI